MVYKTYKKKQKEAADSEFNLLKNKLETRKQIFERIKKIYDKELALLEEAEFELGYHLGEKRKKTAK